MYFGRGENKIKCAYRLKNTYTDYINNIIKGSSFDIEFDLYRLILEDYLKIVAKKILEGEMFAIPARLGHLYVVKKKLNYSCVQNLPINWKEVNAHNGKVIYHLNEHSRGYKYRFYWNRNGILTNNRKLYRLLMTRTNRRELARLIKEEGKDYTEKRQLNKD